MIRLIAVALSVGALAAIITHSAIATSMIAYLLMIGAWFVATVIVYGVWEASA